MLTLLKSPSLYRMMRKWTPVTERSAHHRFLQKLAPAHRSTVFSSFFTQVDIFKHAYGQIPTKLLRMEERNVYCGTYFTKVLLNRLVNLLSPTCSTEFKYKADVVRFTVKTPIA